MLLGDSCVPGCADPSPKGNESALELTITDDWETSTRLRISEAAPPLTSSTSGPHLLALSSSKEVITSSRPVLSFPSAVTLCSTSLRLGGTGFCSCIIIKQKHINQSINQYTKHLERLTLGRGTCSTEEHSESWHCKSSTSLLAAVAASGSSSAG